MSLHTPGPWVRGKLGDVYAGDEIIASTRGRWQERLDNADLIAAAPDMLEALELARADIWEDGPPPMHLSGMSRKALDAIEAAIAKAKGEDQ